MMKKHSVERNAIPLCHPLLISLQFPVKYESSLITPQSRVIRVPLLEKEQTHGRLTETNVFITGRQVLYIELLITKTFK